MTNYEMLLDRLQDIKNESVKKVVKAAVEIGKTYNASIEPANQAEKLTALDKEILSEGLDLVASIKADIESRKELGIW